MFRLHTFDLITYLDLPSDPITHITLKLLTVLYPVGAKSWLENSSEGVAELLDCKARVSDQASEQPAL